MLDLEQEAFVVHVTTFFVELMKVYLSQKVLITTLIADKPLIIILAEYSDFVNKFFNKSTTILAEYSEINTHAINLEEGK